MSGNNRKRVDTSRSLLGWDWETSNQTHSNPDSTRHGYTYGSHDASTNGYSVGQYNYGHNSQDSCSHGASCSCVCHCVEIPCDPCDLGGFTGVTGDIQPPAICVDFPPNLKSGSTGAPPYTLPPIKEGQSWTNGDGKTWIAVKDLCGDNIEWVECPCCADAVVVELGVGSGTPVSGQAADLIVNGVVIGQVLIPFFD